MTEPEDVASEVYHGPELECTVGNLLPGTVYGDSHSFLNQWMAPVDYSIAGTAHSHPGYSNEPSDADLDFFSNMGGVHFITCQPYDRSSWRAYNSRGEQMDLEIIY